VALAGALVEAGARKVYCFDLLTEPHQSWHEMRKGLGEKGDRLVFKTQNVSDEDGIEVAFAEVVKGEGRLDGLVCAAVPAPLPRGELMKRGLFISKTRLTSLQQSTNGSSKRIASEILYVVERLPAKSVPLERKREVSS
jgi:NAD(P)-dependent dehydrogenase (short-subunit alcohol dehydrogenase family)